MTFPLDKSTNPWGNYKNWKFLSTYERAAIYEAKHNRAEEKKEFYSSGCRLKYCIFNYIEQLEKKKKERPLEKVYK